MKEKEESIEYSVRQRTMLKERLYRWALNNSEGSRANWPKVSEAILTITGVHIDENSLRLNIDPTLESEDKQQRSGFKKNSRYQAIYTFLLNQEYFTPRQFSIGNEVTPALAIALEEYLNSSNEPQTLTNDLLFSAISGRFETSIDHFDGVEEITFDIHYAGPEKLVEVTAEFRTMVNTRASPNTVSRIYGGWMVAQPSGFMLMILKRVPSDAYEDDQWFSVIQTSPSFEQGLEYEAIALFQYSVCISGALISRDFLDQTDEKRDSYKARKFDKPDSQKAILLLTRDRELPKSKGQVMTKKRRHFAGALPEKAVALSKEVTSQIDNDFIRLIKSDEYADALAIAPLVQNINHRDARSQATFLHFAAASSAENFLNAIVKLRDDIDFLAVDVKGRRASEIAWHISRNEKLGAWLMQQEKMQAEKEGKPAWPPQEPR